jgi:ketosteroid isomerase-like protein
MMASLATAVLAGCAHSPGGPSVEETIAEIMRLDAAGGQAAARRDAAGTLPNYGHDIVYCGSRGAALGQDGIAAAWKPWFSADGPLVTWAPSGAGVASSGDLGWSTGRSRVEIKDAEGRPKVLAGEYVTVWSKGPGGWKGRWTWPSAGRPPSSVRASGARSVRSARRPATWRRPWGCGGGRPGRGPARAGT